MILCSRLDCGEIVSSYWQLQSWSQFLDLLEHIVESFIEFIRYLHNFLFLPDYIVLDLINPVVELPDALLAVLSPVFRHLELIGNDGNLLLVDLLPLQSLLLTDLQLLHVVPDHPQLVSQVHNPLVGSVGSLLGLF